ncbi:hypothetical protein GGI07_005594 [Coemansia sp. Benny D115]|nr:hypothetical protein GGI07_005594 [Coemansia sp. Benny D115]
MSFGGFGGFGGSTTAASAAPAASSGGGLFGSSAAAPAPSGLFGASTATSAAAPASSGLFGSFTSTSAAPATSGGLFGSSAATSAAPASAGLFGSTTATATSAAAAPASSSASGLFGSANISTTAAPATGLFGSAAATASAASAAAPATSSLLGSAAASAAPPVSTAPFPSLSTPSAPAATASNSTAAAASASAAITRKTKFVDLPADVQKMLVEIERQKQVQIQIGSSILADETEKEMKEVSRTVQRLAQDLEVVRMTLSGDRERVDDAKAQVNFAAKHAEKAASLVAHATDDGSWAQSGLTPLQVVNRQKALLALQNSGEVAATTPVVDLKDIADQKLLGEGALSSSSASGASSVDPFEAVRRIQFASMHYDVANEYYWAWLSRVEASAQLLAERLDQLERHVSVALAHAQGAGGGDDYGCSRAQHHGQQQQGGVALQSSGGAFSARPSPRAVADVIQYQNDSLLAVASKVALLDDDLRRLRKKLGLRATALGGNNGS